MKVNLEERHGQLIPVSAEIENDKEVEFLLDQLRPKGEWIRVEPTEEDIERNLVPLERIECSNCHLPNRHILYDEYHDEMTVTYHNTHYCPNCGAKMSISEGRDV